MSEFYPKLRLGRPQRFDGGPANGGKRGVQGGQGGQPGWVEFSHWPMCGPMARKRRCLPVRSISRVASQRAPSIPGVAVLRVDGSGRACATTRQIRRYAS